MKYAIAKKTLELEAQAVKDQIKHLDNSFVKAVALLKNCRGRVFIMGLGKSGLIGRKISATMSSIGIPSAFVHYTESLHGDIGMIMKNDIVIMLSYSGGSDEIKKVIQVLGKMHVLVIAMTGNVKAQNWNGVSCVINCSIRQEACPFNIAPTTSTTAMLAMGDALALTVSQLKGFKREDFALLHPLGGIGKSLMKVSEIMRKGQNNPVVKDTSAVKDALLIMTKTKVGATSVVNKSGKLTGFFTDGDLRRRLQRDNRILNRKISEVMTKMPRTILPDMTAKDAAKVLKEYNIDNIPVVNKDGKPVGILDQGDLLAEGIA